MINQNWITIFGESVTGRTPVSVHSIGTISDASMNMAAMVYSDFCNSLNVSITPIKRLDTVLDDGTEVSIVSSFGVDRIWVKGTESESKYLLPHGFAVYPSWVSPVIYGPVDGNWEVTHPWVPQLLSDSGYDGFRYTQQEEIYAPPGEDESLEFVPHVYDKNGWWGYQPFGDNDWTEVDGTMIVLRDGGEKIPRKEFLVANALDVYKRDEAGALVVDHHGADPDPILFYDTEKVHYFPPRVSLNGADAVLGAARWAVVSPTMKMSFYRLVSEAISRSGATLNLLKRLKVEIVAKPTANQAVTVDDKTTPGLFGPGEYDPGGWCLTKGTVLTYGAGKMWGKYQQVTQGDFWTRTTLDGGSFPFDTWMIDPDDARPIWTWDEASHGYKARYQPPGDSEYVESGYTVSSGWRTGFVQVNGPVKKVDVILAPGTSGYETITLDYAVSYPADKLFRGGADWSATNTDNCHSWYSVATKQITYYRSNAKYLIDATPNIALGLSWAQPRLFDGKCRGVLSGSSGHTTYLMGGYGFDNGRKFIINAADISTGSDSIDPCPPGPAPGTIYTVGHDAFLATQALPDANAKLIAFSAKYPDTVVSEPTNLAKNTIDYTYSSLYITDFDNLARFYAGVEFKVECAGYVAEQLTGADSVLTVTANPSYKITCYFTFGWYGPSGFVTDKKELFTSKCKRPGFEFDAMPDGVPWAWNDEGAGKTFHMPPKLTMPADGYIQLMNIGGHQGNNKHFAGSQYKGPTQAQFESTKGVEFSEPPDGEVNKYVPGMLYSRTFKVTDFDGAAWLLSSTNCDAAEHLTDAGPAWFWMPDMPEKLGREFHIEIRDGAFVQWTDDMNPPPDVEVKNRNLAIYLV